MLNESVGAGYIDRNWPPALKESGAWPLTSLRQSFLNGSLTRLIDPDAVLRNKIVEFVGNGDFGLSSGQRPDGTYERVWYKGFIAPEEVAFEPGVFLLTKEKANALKVGLPETKQTFPEPIDEPSDQVTPVTPSGYKPEVKATTTPQISTLKLAGIIPPELWNRLGTKILPKLRAGTELQVGIDFRVTVDASLATSMKSELHTILDDLGLRSRVQIEVIESVTPVTHWDDLRQRRWTYIEDDQIFPWGGRELFVYLLIPHLIQGESGRTFEFYRDAALLASCPERCNTLLLQDDLRDKYQQLKNKAEWLQFPKEHRTRPRQIREALLRKNLISIDSNTSSTSLQNGSSLPPLPNELKSLLPLILKAADNLEKLQLQALSQAEAVRLNVTQMDITNELQALMVA